ncbi:hypothetical protein CBOM_07908 [Ceraceosorus bombacis]|uniref:Uncharacterized protein n=1 Tax=Ceraceosorus bombacis TaxID=401625 RepID=A0A0P1BQ13_9BASI|nr:hypothetical protein CBOM_07908 [Ceraceosorus bombacis]
MCDSFSHATIALPLIWLRIIPGTPYMLTRVQQRVQQALAPKNPISFAKPGACVVNLPEVQEQAKSCWDASRLMRRKL